MSQFEAVLLLGMGVITFAIRYTLFAVGHRVRFSPLVQQALGYVPVAVLTAIIVPAVVMPDGNSLQLTLDNAYLVGGVVAVGRRHVGADGGEPSRIRALRRLYGAAARARGGGRRDGTLDALRRPRERDDHRRVIGEYGQGAGKSAEILL